MALSLRANYSRVLFSFLISGSLTLSYSSGANARFISPDPMDPTLAGVNTNRYAYALNEPINNSDANGHFAVAGAVVGAAIGVAVQAAMDTYNGRSIRRFIENDSSYSV